MESFTILDGIAAPLVQSNIDTGVIIALRFLRSRATDLGAGLSGSFTLSGSALDVQIQAVPEPSAWGALAWGVGMLIGFRRFRQRVPSV